MKVIHARPVSSLTVMSDQTLLDVSDISEEVTHCCDLASEKERSQHLRTLSKLKNDHVYYK